MIRIALIGSIESQDLLDAHILKDACIIPILLEKYFGYKSQLIAYSINEDLLHEYFPFAEFVSIYKTGNYMQDVEIYLKEHAIDIDIVYMFGGYPSYLTIAQWYKQYNSKGKIYLKLDMNRWWLSRVIKEKYFIELLNICDLVTAECKLIQDQININLNCNVELIPNGYYEYFATQEVQYLEKENIILTVGRLGTSQKRTDILLKAFLEADLPGWQLRMVGTMDKQFLPILKELENNEKYTKQVTNVGYIENKKQLEEEYRKAKIFCMTSVCEGYAHVYVEAAKNGCYIVTTDVDCAYDITQNQKTGSIHAVGDWKAIAEQLSEIKDNDQLLSHICKETQQYARYELEWNTIVSKIKLLFEIKGMI